MTSNPALTDIKIDDNHGQPIRPHIPADDGIHALLHSADRSVWLLAAAALAMTPTAPEDRRRAAQDVLDAIGLPAVPDGDRSDVSGLAAQAAAPVLQASALLLGGSGVWAEQSDAAVITQGRASAQGAEAFFRFGLPVLTGLPELLSQPGARMLDVGTGIAALAVAYAELLPNVTVVGIDVLPRVLDLARHTVLNSHVAARVELREQSVRDVDETDTYALAWVPAPFIPEPALRAGISALLGALVPGGWIMVGHGKFGTHSLDNAITQFKTHAYGGTALNNAQAQQTLVAAGFANVATLLTPPGSPGITVGRKRN